MEHMVLEILSHSLHVRRRRVPSSPGTIASLLSRRALLGGSVVVPVWVGVCDGVCSASAGGVTLTDIVGMRTVEVSLTWEWNSFARARISLSLSLSLSLSCGPNEG